MEKLSAEDVYKVCEIEHLGVGSTAELEPLHGTVGQERALRSLEFGLDMPSQGFNIYVLGEAGTGKMTTIRALLEKKAAEEEVPADWCYVYNFKDPDVPRAMKFEPGRGVVLQKDMHELIKVLKEEIPKVYDSKAFEKQKAKIVEDFQKRQKELFAALEEEAKGRHFSIRKMQNGLAMVPIKKDETPLTDEEFESLEPEMKKAVDRTGKELQEKLDDVVRQVRQEEKTARDRVAGLEREAVLPVVNRWIEELESKFRNNEQVVRYLEEVKEDILEHIDEFKPKEETPQLPFMRPPKQENTMARYQVNLLVHRNESKGAPVVIEKNPTYFNLFGRVEHKVQYGMALTDFTMIKAGSLHRANGGYLVINALDLLKNMFSYDALKRAVKNRQLSIEDIWEQYRLVSTVAMRPEPIPLDVKIVLIGAPYIYYMLYNLDEEYRKYFKVKADFDSKMERSDKTARLYAEFICGRCGDEGLLPFDKSGIARVVEFGSRLAEHQEKLSARFGVISDIVREAGYWAGKDGAERVTGEYVDQAIREKRYRNNRVEDLIQEAILEDTFIVETTGAKIGQINGLAVLGTGDTMFGKPSRITARTYAGKRGVVNIERETKMSGKIHEKAIMILTAYLGARFAQEEGLGLTASIGFEQLYEGIEGDSATCAELYVLLSSIGGVELRQDLAVTGSMDQHGEVQPIGGVNEKIEGFFDVCQARGLTGEQGVVIPARNKKNLMLRPDVVRAVREGTFHIYAINRVEEGLELFAGMPVGEPTDEGFPEGTVFRSVADGLARLAKASRGKKEDKGNEGDNDAGREGSNKPCGCPE